MTTDTYAPAVTTYAPPTPLTWQALTLANPSLLSWERSAAAAGAKQLGWWCRWASDSRILRRHFTRHRTGGVIGGVLVRNGHRPRQTP